MVPFAACMGLVASLYGLPPRVLASIQDVEGGRPGLVSPNSNGTQDLGVMQVNSAWVPALATYTGLPAATVRDRLIGDPCFNIGAAGAIMRRNLDESGGDLLLAVGHYHSHKPELQASYQERVVMAARRLFWAPIGPPAKAPALAAALRIASFPDGSEPPASAPELAAALRMTSFQEGPKPSASGPKLSGCSPAACKPASSVRDGLQP